MKWKQFGNKVFTGIIIIALAIVVLISFADIEKTNWLGGFIWFLIGVVILIIIGFIMWCVGFSFVHFARNAWDIITKTKEQREQEREQEKSRQEFLDDLRRRGIL